MISNDEQLKTVREQIQRLKSALSALERDVRPKNEGQFQVLSEGYVDQIAELEALAEIYVVRSDAKGGPAGNVVALKR